MMRNIISILGAILVFWGCSNGSSAEKDNDVTDTSITATDAKYYIDNEVYIGSEICYDTKDAVIQPVADTMTAQTKAKWAAAIFRYFSVTELNGGEYKCKARTGGELRMSEKVFKMLDDNLKELNKWTKEMKENNMPEPEVTPISKEYLETMYEYKE